jgi:hypothetical protein
MTRTYLERNPMLTDDFAPEGKEHTPIFTDERTSQESMENIQCESPIGDGSQASDHEMPRWKPCTLEFNNAQYRFLKARQPAGV